MVTDTTSQARRFRLKRGLDIPVVGAPDLSAGIDVARPARSVALVGADYVGLRAHLLVKPGDRVALGAPLFTDKADPTVCYVAPGSGTVTEVNLGARRSLRSVVIELDDPYEEASATYASATVRSGAPAAEMTGEEIREVLCRSGLWPALRARPYGHVARSDRRPAAVFVTAMDTQPLAVPPATVLAGHGEVFLAGLKLLEALTDGSVFLCTGPDWPDDFVPDRRRVQHAVFDGPHPAGLVGTHIHHLYPVGIDREVWYLGYQDVAAIGRYFRYGEFDTQRVVSLGGPGFARPRLLRTRLGASLREVVRDEWKDEVNPAAFRLISGSVLAGRRAEGADAYLGRYHLQVCSLADMAPQRTLGWAAWRSSLPSVAGGIRPRRHRRTQAAVATTALGGWPGAMVAVEALEHLVPMDVLVAPLLRALLIGDSQGALDLGCLELEPEDLALCTFVCPGKNDYGAVLAENLLRIAREEG